MVQGFGLAVRAVGRMSSSSAALARYSSSSIQRVTSLSRVRTKSNSAPLIAPRAHFSLGFDLARASVAMLRSSSFSNLPIPEF